MDYLKYLSENFDLVFVGSILTFLTILFAFYNQVAVPMYNTAVKPFVDFMASVAHSPTRLRALETTLGGKLDAIMAELKPNGGSSIKDQLNRLETAVSISQAERLLLLDSVQQGVFTSDIKGQCIWVNDAFRKAVGGSMADFVGNNWENVVYPDDRETVSREWGRAIDQQRDFNLHYRLHNLSTSAPVKVHAIATPARNFAGDVIGWNGVIHFTK